jgi:DNA polymerase elongation subunit (family B)
MFVNLDNKQLEQLQDIKFIGGWEDDSDVFLWSRENGNRKIFRIPEVSRYFCIERSQFEKSDKSKWKHWKEEGLYDHGNVTGKYAYVFSKNKIYKSNWNNWLTVLEDSGMKPLEGDISRISRLMIDYQLQVAGPADENSPRTVYFDIETDDRADEILIGNERIVSVAWKDGQTGEEFFERLQADTDDAEKDFLTKVYKAFVLYDVRIGYNNYQFDDLYLEIRFDRYKLDLSKWKRIASLDIFNIFERQGTYRKYDVRNRKLDTIGKAVLNRGKIEHSEKIWELWSNNPEKLEEYNMEDVRLIYDMEAVLGSVNLVLSVCSFAGLLHSLNYSPAKTVDTFLLRSAQRRRNKFDFRYGTSYYRPEHMATGKFGAFSRNALPSDKRKGRREILDEQFGIDYEPVLGALVMEADPGLYRNVHAFDFQSLYPNTIRAFNIGHDTLVNSENTDLPRNQAPNGVFYRTDIISGMSDGVTFLIDKRREVRAGLKLENDEVRIKALDILQRGIKELTNSFYGVTAQYGGRYYSKDIAESITSGGRTFLPFGDEFFAARGHKVVIGDTDSLYISLTDDINPEKINKEYIDALYEMLHRKYNVFKPEYLKMSYEKRMESVLIIAKKLYSAWVIMEDGQPIPGHLVNKGLMLLKGNYPKWATNVCLEILNDLLSGKYTEEEHYLRIINREKDKLANGKVDWHELLISARIGKSLTEYQNENALCHVRIARRLAASGKHIPVYSTISYLITDGSADPMEGIADEEINSNTEYDAVHYWNNILIKQVKSLLSPVFETIDWEKIKFPRYLKRNNYFEMKVKINDN